MTLLVVLPLAGCLAGGPAGPTASAPDGADGDPVPVPPDYDFSQVVDDPHEIPYGHMLPDLHTEGHGLAKVGHTPVAPNPATGVTPGGYSEVDVHGDWAAVGSFAGTRGFSLVDLSDPASPTVTSHYETPGDAWDVRFSDDGDHVFVGMQGGHAPVPGLPMHAGDAGAQGIAVVDVRDRADPKLESVIETSSVHNLFARTIDNVTWVVNNDGQIFRLDGDEGAHELRQVAKVASSHDVHIERHPVLDRWVLYTGASGLTLYDFTDPTEPELLGQLDGEGTAGHEQLPIPETIDGRAIVVGGGEALTGAELPTWVFDVTDPGNITALGNWQPEHTAETPGFFHLTLHNMAYHDGMVSIAQYHAGIWLVDISTGARLEEPVTLGAYQPHDWDADNPLLLPYVPWVWGGDWTDEGRLVVPDFNTGLYVLEPELTYG